MEKDQGKGPKINQNIKKKMGSYLERKFGCEEMRRKMQEEATMME